MPHQDSHSEEVVNQWLARYEDELVHSPILPDEFLVREGLAGICSGSQLQSIKNGLRLAYDEYLRSERTIIADLSGLPESEEDLSRVQRIFENNFKIVKLLGQGGFGSVYLAKEMAESNRLVAIKVLDHVLGKERFLREVHLTSLISHPNLIPIFNSGESNGKLYYCMPYFRALPEEGPFQNCVTLNDVLKQQSNLELSMQQVASMMRDVVRGLKTLHDILPQDSARLVQSDKSHQKQPPESPEEEMNASNKTDGDSQQPGQVIHRDIKPGNILLTRTEDRLNCVLSDFGLAKIVDNSVDLTVTEQFMGSCGYASPEQIHNSKSTDVRSDIYSLGATFYQFVTNRLPSNQLDSLKIIEWHTQEVEPVAARDLNPHVDVRFEAILRHCLRCRPDDRYQSSSQLLDDLDRYLDGKDVQAPVLRPGQRVLDRFSRNRQKIIRSAFVSSLLLVAVIASFVAYRYQSMPPQEIIIPEAPALNVAKLFQEVNVAIKQGDVAKAVSRIEPIPQKANGWLKSYLQARVSELPQIDKIVADHDWGVTNLLVGESGLISAGLDQRLQFTTHDYKKQFDLLSGLWIPEPGIWQPAFDFRDPKQFLPDSACIVGMSWAKANQILVTASWSGRANVWKRLEEGSFESTQLLMHNQPLTAVASRNSVHLLGDTLGQLIVVDADQQTICKLLKQSPIVSIVPLNNGSWVIGQSNGILNLLDEKCERIVDSLTLPSQIFDVKRSPGGAIAVAAGSMVMVLDAGSRFQDRHIFFELPLSNSARKVEFHTVCFDEQEKVLVAGDSTGRLLAWNLSDGTIICHEFALKHGFQRNFTTQLPTPLSRQITAIRRIPHENAFYVAGWNGLVQTWRFKPKQSATMFDSPECLDSCFIGDEQLILLDADGLLTRFNVTTGELLEKQSLPVSAPQGLCCLNQTTLLVWDNKGAVYEISLDAKRHVLKTEVIFQNDHAIKALVSNRAGDRFYFYDSQGNVGLWQRDKNAVTAWYRQPDRQTPYRFVLAYSSPLNKLAISGSGQTIHVLDGSSLSLIQSPDLAAGNGCTHLAWAGLNKKILFAGDSEGSVRAAGFSGSPSPKISGHELHAELAGIISSGDGEEVYVVTTTGTMQRLSPTTGQTFCTFQVLQGLQEDSKSQSTASIIDPTSQQIALLTNSNRSIILHGKRADSVQQPIRKSAWKQKTLWRDPHIKWIRSRQEAVLLTASDQFAMIYSTRKQAETSEKLWIAREQQKSFSVHQFAEVDLTGLKDHQDYFRSIVLQANGTELRGVYRQRITKEQGYDGELNGIKWTDTGSKPETWFEKIVQGNLGFENHLIVNEQGDYQVLTFEHATRGLLLVDLQTANMQRIGRQGDGLYFYAVSQNGQTDVVSIPNRFNSEPFRVWHHRIISQSDQVTSKRRVLDAHHGSRPVSVAGRNNEIITLVRRVDQQRQLSYLLLREDDDNKAEQLLPIRSAARKVSNIAVTPDGRCFVASIDQSKQLSLCTVDSSGHIKQELISEGPLQQPFRASVTECLVLRLTQNGHPEICLFADGPNGSSISIYQQESR